MIVWYLFDSLLGFNVFLEKFLQFRKLMKVLVVDRVKLFQNIIASALQGTEIEYEFAESGAASIDLLEKDKFEIICIAMYLDDMDAIQLTRKIRKIKSYAHTPVALLTSEESNAVTQNAMKSGIIDIFEKKDVEQLVNFIRRFGFQNYRVTGRVLYIEDTLSQQLLVTDMLQQRGLEVDSYTSGEDAFAAFIKNDYDIVLTDIVLDGVMSGVTLANRIRRLSGYKGDVPILAVTAFDNISRRIGLFHLGINDYVIKPIIEEELVARIKSLVENYRSVLAIQQEKQKALQANAAKSEFLSLMSHELRTPLNSIMRNLHLMQLDAKKENLKAEFVDSLIEVEEASEHLLSLINEVLDISKIEAGEAEIILEVLQVKSVTQAAIQIIRHAMSERGITLHEKFSDDLPNAIADSTRLKQALINLLANAVKYNKAGGEIFVATQYKKESNEVLITIRDTGPGLAPETCQGLFKKFHRGGNEGSKVEGSGLGLYVTRKMLLEMDADITVKSKLGKGTEFSIQLKAKKS